MGKYLFLLPVIVLLPSFAQGPLVLGRFQGLIELVFGDDRLLFPTLSPRWLNWPILQAFLAPMCPHFGISMCGLLDPD